MPLITPDKPKDVYQVLRKNVIVPGLCTGCGACVALCDAGRARMIPTAKGPIPEFFEAEIPETVLQVCPAYRLSYPDLYRWHYGALPASWLLGNTIGVRTGYAGDERVREIGASGGILTAVLCHLLRSGKVDAVLAVRQGVGKPEEAGVVICETVDAIIACAQSVYVPVSVLDHLHRLIPGKKYALTCLPDQAAALRALQQLGLASARQIHYVVGPYTGTALYPAALRCFLASRGVKRDDAITSLQWRAGEWPGHLEIKTASGRVLTSPKVYYNYLIPFFVTQNSLQNMDFANEFCDVAVGDAWSPAFEALGKGFAVFTTRTLEMEEVVKDMIQAKELMAEVVDPLQASEMHGHMLDFKKRGGYIRNQLRRRLGRPAPDFGMRPAPLPWPRIMVELVIVGIFFVCRSCWARAILALIPERMIGPLFNRLRLFWKRASKPTKRKGLAGLTMIETGG